MNSNNKINNVAVKIAEAMDEIIKDITGELEEQVKETVEEQLGKIDTDNISGLDEFVEKTAQEVVDNLQVRAEDVNDLDAIIDCAIDIIDCAIDEALSSHTIDTESITDFEDAVDTKIKKHLENLDIDSDHVLNLDDAIDYRLRRTMEKNPLHADEIIGLDDKIDTYFTELYLSEDKDSHIINIVNKQITETLNELLEERSLWNKMKKWWSRMWNFNLI